MKKKTTVLNKSKSLRGQIFLLVLLVGLIPVTIVSQVFLKLYERSSIDSDVAYMTSQMQQLNQQVITSGYVNGTESPVLDERLSMLAKAYSGRIMTVNASLKVVRDTYGVDEGKVIVWEDVVRSMKGSTVSYYDRENSNLIVAIPITPQTDSSDHKPQVQGVFVVCRSMDYMVQNLEHFRSVEIIMLLLTYIIVITSAVISSRRFVMPLHRISKSISDVTGGAEEKPVPVNDYAETEEISKNLTAFMEKMAIVDESRQEFVSNVSHELKTPLTSMKVLADSLNGQEDVPVELYREFMVDIGNEIDRENKIINDLLSLVKMDRSANTMNITRMNVNDVLELILKRLKPIAEKQNVELVMESFRPVTAEIDEVKFTLAITNLVENGIKYNREGGWVHVSINADHQYFYIKVEDSGMGIPEDSLDHIFERFYRVDKSHSREIGGTGLGLAITRNAVLMHHGAIKVHSTLGEGTTFDVRIPLNYIAKEEKA